MNIRRRKKNKGGKYSFLVRKFEQKREDSKVIGQGNDRRIFLSIFLLAELFLFHGSTAGRKKELDEEK